MVLIFLLSGVMFLCSSAGLSLVIAEIVRKPIGTLTRRYGFEDVVLLGLMGSAATLMGLIGAGAIAFALFGSLPEVTK